MRLSTTTLARGSARRPWLTLGALGGRPGRRRRGHRARAPGHPHRAVQLSRATPTRKRGRDLLAAAHEHAAEGQRGRHRALARRRAATDPAFRAEVLGLQKQIAALGPGVVDSVASALPGRRQDAHLGRRPHGDPPGRHGRRPHAGREEHRQGPRGRARRRRQGRLRHAGHRHRQHQQRLQPDRRDRPAARARASACRSPSSSC